jgi:FdhD protein
LEQTSHSRTYPAIRCKKGGCRITDFDFIAEEPLLIRIDDAPYSVVMRTPGQELFHAAGFCLGEGIADTPDDFATIGFCKDLDPNVVDIRLTPARREQIPDLLERRGFVSQTSCGICGKEMVKDLFQVIHPMKDDFTVGVSRVSDCLDKLFEQQSYYPKTRGSHAAMIFDERLEAIAFAEDVGRHNALDKAIGRAFLEQKLASARLLTMSSRISYELVQKAARARLSVIVSKSRPTALALEMGTALNMTLVCAFSQEELLVVCGDRRIVRQ